jgi:23S rRNA pseudouridine2605 synthase
MISLALFHKPVGVQSTVGDPYGRPSLSTVASDLLDLGLHPVGRLDAATDGLLLFARDGAITQHLLHPKRAVPRVYVATVSPAPDPAALAERLAAGVATSEGTFTAELRACDGDRVTLAVTEGRHRMVRRMLANAGHPVVALRRIAFGAFELGDLAPGAWREPTEEERAWLHRSVNKSRTMGLHDRAP